MTWRARAQLEISDAALVALLLRLLYAQQSKEPQMDDAAAQAIKADLDRALIDVGPNVGIAFGTELFAEFRKRGWLTLETFGVLGTTFLATKLPAYARSHYAFETWDVPDLEFRVGKDERQT